MEEVTHVLPILHQPRTNLGPFLQRNAKYVNTPRGHVHSETRVPCPTRLRPDDCSGALKCEGGGATSAPDQSARVPRAAFHGLATKIEPTSEHGPRVVDDALVVLVLSMGEVHANCENDEQDDKGRSVSV